MRPHDARDAPIDKARSNNRYWTAALSLDFAKFVFNTVAPAPKNPPKGASPRLRLLYRYYSETDQGLPGATPGDSHFLGMAFRTTLQ